MRPLSKWIVAVALVVVIFACACLMRTMTDIDRTHQIRSALNALYIGFDDFWWIHRKMPTSTRDIEPYALPYGKLLPNGMPKDVTFSWSFPTGELPDPETGKIDLILSALLPSGKQIAETFELEGRDPKRVWNVNEFRTAEGIDALPDRECDLAHALAWMVHRYYEDSGRWPPRLADLPSSNVKKMFEARNGSDRVFFRIEHKGEARIVVLSRDGKRQYKYSSDGPLEDDSVEFNELSK